MIWVAKSRMLWRCERAHKLDDNNASRFKIRLQDNKELKKEYIVVEMTKLERRAQIATSNNHSEIRLESQAKSQRNATTRDTNLENEEHIKSKLQRSRNCDVESTSRSQAKQSNSSYRHSIYYRLSIQRAHTIQSLYLRFQAKHSRRHLLSNVSLIQSRFWIDAWDIAYSYQCSSNNFECHTSTWDVVRVMSYSWDIIDKVKAI